MESTIKIANCSENRTEQINQLSLASRSSMVPVKTSTCSHIWTIYNFSECLKQRMLELNSSRFSENVHDEVKWGLQLKIQMKTIHPNENYIELYVNGTYGVKSKVNADTTRVIIQLRCSILNVKDEERNKMAKNYYLHGGNEGFEKFIKRDFLLDESNGLLHNDILKIFCEVNVIVKTHTAEVVKVDLSKHLLSQDFKLLFENKEFSDVSLYVGKIKFEAHKVILAARSPVFRAMFKHKMKELKNGRVDITDIDHEILNELLLYIYTDKVPNLKTLAQDLLVAADKYALERLKELCEQELCSNLSIENVIQMLSFAELAR